MPATGYTVNIPRAYRSWLFKLSLKKIRLSTCHLQPSLAYFATYKLIRHADCPNTPTESAKLVKSTAWRPLVCPKKLFVLASPDCIYCRTKVKTSTHLMVHDRHSIYNGHATLKCPRQKHMLGIAQQEASGTPETAVCNCIFHMFMREHICKLAALFTIL